jgi:hypothetical protein
MGMIIIILVAVLIIMVVFTGTLIMFAMVMLIGSTSERWVLTACAPGRDGRAH